MTHNTATSRRPSRLRVVALLLAILLAACHCHSALGHASAHHHLHHHHDARTLTKTASDTTDNDCGADATTPEEVEKLQAIMEQQQQQPSLRASSLATTTTTTAIAIPVFFHILLQSDGQTHTTGIITDEQVVETIRLLNEAYQETTPFYFYLKEPPQRTINFSWYSSKCTKESDSAFKLELRQGGSDALNIYVCDTTLSGYLGWATYPWQLSDDRIDPLQDGTVITYKAVYGAQPEFVRHTLTHEVGHWLGLWHTYENGCDGAGDGVKDTPSHLQSKTNCTLPNQDTCVDALYSTYANFDKGLDPRNNYMDTSNEECRSEFTPGQTRRMLTMFQTFRMNNRTDPNFVPPPAVPTPSSQSTEGNEPIVDGTTTTTTTTNNLGRSDCTLAGGVCAEASDCCQTDAQTLICAESVCVTVQKMNLDADADKDDTVRLFDDQQGRGQDRGGIRRQRRRLGRGRRRWELKGSSTTEI